MLDKNLKFLTILLSLSLLISACSNKTGTDQGQAEAETLPQVEITEVSFNGIQQYKVNGEVTAGQSANLSAEFKADVSSIRVKPGDYVQKDEVLLTLDSDSIEQSYTTAQQTLKDSQNTLSKTYESTEKSVESAKTTLETVQTSYDNLLIQNAISRTQAKEQLNSTKLNLNLSTASAQTTLETAQKALEQRIEVNTTTEASAHDTLENVINSIESNIVTAINISDELLGVSEIYDDAASVWENNLGALNKNTKITAETFLKDLIEKHEKYEESYDTAKSILETADISLDATLDMLKNSTSGANYSQNTLSSNINTVTAKINTIQSLLTSLISAQNALTQTLASNTASLTSAQQAVESAQKNLDLTLQDSNGESQSIINAETLYESTIAQLDSAEDNALKQLESARVTYEAAIKSANLSKTSAQAGLTNAQGGFQQAKISQEKLLIKAPFAGTVVDIPVKTGEEVNVGALLAQVENNTILKIVSYLTTEQVNRLKVGDKVKIATQSEDVISAISKTVDPTIKKYKVEILHQNPYLHSGQTVPLVFTANLNLANAEGTVFIPMVAVHITSSKSFVWVVNENMQAIKKTIVTGEISGNRIAITNGLSEGDKVIIKGGRLFQKEGISVEVINRL